MLIAITYHYVRPDFSGCSGGIHGVTCSEFERQLEILAKRGTFVEAADVLAAVDGRKELPSESVLITFDDGLREQYEHALPILNRMGIPAIFFVNTRPIAEQRLCTVHKVHIARASLAPQIFERELMSSAETLEIELQHTSDPAKVRAQYPYDTEAVGRLKFLLNFGLPLRARTDLIEATFARIFPGMEWKLSRELYMNREQLTELSCKGAIGSHGHDHLPIGELSDDHAEATIAESVTLLQTWTERTPFAMSYPYGTRDTCSPTTARIAAKHGIRMGFTVESAGNNCESLKSPQFLGRFDCNLMPGGKRPLWGIEELFEGVPPCEWHRPVSPKEVRRESQSVSVAVNR